MFPMESNLGVKPALDLPGKDNNTLLICAKLLVYLPSHVAFALCLLHGNLHHGVIRHCGDILGKYTNIIRM
eukprot:1394638-Amorphochlora_amoeboformis.AAC.1